jgi:RNA polymerase sigma-70 factor (TIGR02960 family)
VSCRSQPGQLDAPWLEPYPDALMASIADPAPGPDARYDAREAIALAFIATLQLLPPNQRAILILRDVLGFRASEVAEMLEMSEGAVTGALQRARETLATRKSPRRRDQAALPNPEFERQVVTQFVEAFQEGDIASVIALLTNDATFTMPPEPLLYQGHEAIAALLANRFSWRGANRLQLIETRANAQPAFGCYLRDPHTPIAHAHGMIVLTLEGDQITAITRFLDNSILAQFGLPRTIRD